MVGVAGRHVDATVSNNSCCRVGAMVGKGRVASVSIGLVSAELGVVDGVAGSKNGRKGGWDCDCDCPKRFEGAIVNTVDVPDDSIDDATSCIELSELLIEPFLEPRDEAELPEAVRCLCDI